MQLTPRATVALIRIASELGPDEDVRLSADLQREVRRLTIAAQRAAQQMRVVFQRAVDTASAALTIGEPTLRSPMLRRVCETWRKARHGDRATIIELIRNVPAAALRDESISQEIERAEKEWPQDPEARQFLRDVTDAFHKGLARPGRPNTVPPEAGAISIAIQDAFDTAPKELKKRDGNPVREQRRITQLSEHIAKDVDPEYREAARVRIKDVLTTSPRVKALGVHVVAGMFRRTHERIRSLIRKEKAGTNPAN